MNRVQGREYAASASATIGGQVNSLHVFFPMMWKKLMTVQLKGLLKHTRKGDAGGRRAQKVF